METQESVCFRSNPKWCVISCALQPFSRLLSLCLLVWLLWVSQLSLCCPVCHLCGNSLLLFSLVSLLVWRVAGVLRGPRDPAHFLCWSQFFGFWTVILQLLCLSEIITFISFLCVYWKVVSCFLFLFQHSYEVPDMIKFHTKYCVWINYRIKYPHILKNVS